MRWAWMALGLGCWLAVTGCQRKDADTDAPPPPLARQGLAVVEEQAPAAAAPPRTQDPQCCLARHHTLTLRVDRSAVKPLADRVMAACAAARDAQCTVLRADVGGVEGSRAELELRATPAGVARLMADFQREGSVQNQRLDVEDLRTQMVDSERRMAMLTDLRERLLALRKQPTKDVDALLKITEKLSETQNEIETLQATLAGLKERVTTELLTLQFESIAPARPHWPDAFSGTRLLDSLLESVSTLLHVLVGALPWLAVGLPALWALRRWRRRKAG